MFGFLVRNIKKGLVYTGNILDIEYCIDDTETLSWFNHKPDDVEFQNIAMNIYGNNYNFILPIYLKDKEEINDIEYELKDYLAIKGQERIISDVIIGIWYEVLKEYNICTVGLDGFVCFRKKIYEDILESKKKTNKEIGQDILKKEFLDGYVRVDKYKMKQGNGFEEVDISTDYTFGDEIVPFNYTAKLREAMFGEASKRLGTGKLMMDWQYDVIWNMGRITFVCGPRRVGKTFLMSFLTQRDVIGQKFGFQNSSRPISVIYIGLTRAKNMKVVNYISKMLSAMGADNMFKFDTSTNNYRFISGKDVLGEVTFVSAEAKDPGVGDYADIIILDEAAKLSPAIFKGVEPIVYTEGAKLIAISTLYKNSKKGRFYDKLLQYEAKTIKMSDYRLNERFSKTKGLDLSKPEGQQRYTEIVKDFGESRYYVGLRYTVDDIEYISEAEKQRLRDEYKNDPVRYMSELYSRFPDEGKVFEYEQVLQSADKIKDYMYEYLVIGYDPALTKDTSPLIIVGYSKTLNKPVIFKEYSLPLGVSYGEQITEIKKVIDHSKRFVSNPNNIFFVMDGTHKATAEMLQMNGINVSMRVVFTGGQNISVSKIANEHAVPKPILVDIVRNFIMNGSIEISSSMQGLIKELDGYQEIESRTGKSQYEGVGTTDDKVSAMLVAMYYLSEVLGLKYSIMSQKKGEVKTVESTMTDREQIMKYHQDKIDSKMLSDLRSKLIEQNQSYFRKNIY